MGGWPARLGLQALGASGGDWGWQREGAKAWFAITPDSTKALREQAEKEQQAKIVAFPAEASA